MLDDRMHLCERILTAPFSASRLAMYGAPAAVGVMLFANGIPRVQRDILQKIPILGGFFRKEVHPADNVSLIRIEEPFKSDTNCVSSPSKSTGVLRKIDVGQRRYRLSL
ncbi:hypothetical protein HYE68_003533 [Fusarium pseudograminearum]|nr:hypothetical protein HYE68_003533 [Fusarium pseudograminearum]